MKLLFFIMMFGFSEMLHASENDSNPEAVIFQLTFALGVLTTAMLVRQKIKSGKSKKLICFYAIAGAVIAYALAYAVSFVVFVATFHT
jgi:hypothetical protein